MQSTTPQHRARIGFGALLVSLAAVAGCAAPAATSAPAATTAAGGGATAGPVATSAATGGAATTPAGAVTDACTLLTNDDIKEITGYAVAKVMPNPPDTVFPSACEWTLTGATWQVVLGATPPGGSPSWDQLVPYMTGKTVTGIGDEAFLSDAAGDLFVRKGGTVFNIQYVAFGEPKDTQDRLAKRVAEHLP